MPHVSLPDWMIAFLNEQAELVEQGILDAEYTWNGTDNMDLFECDDFPYYKPWEEKRIYEDELDEQRKKRNR